MKSAISAEMLERLGIRPVAEEQLGGEDAVLAEPIPCWALTAEAIERMTEYGYNTSRRVDTGYDQITFVATANPDGSPAAEEVDPAEVRLVTDESWDGSRTFLDAMKEYVKEKL